MNDYLYIIIIGSFIMIIIYHDNKRYKTFFNEIVNLTEVLL